MSVTGESCKLEMTTTNLEQTQSFDSVQLVKREAVVDASRYDKQISREDVDADPLVRGMFCVSAAYVSITRYPERVRTF